MKFTWETEDVVANYGQVVSTAPNAEHFMFAYENGSGLNPCLVSLRDGMICHTGLGMDGFAKMLNENGFKPFQYQRPMLETTVLEKRQRR